MIGYERDILEELGHGEVHHFVKQDCIKDGPHEFGRILQMSLHSVIIYILHSIPIFESGLYQKIFRVTKHAVIDMLNVLY